MLKTIRKLNFELFVGYKPPQCAHRNVMNFVKSVNSLLSNKRLYAQSGTFTLKFQLISCTDNILILN